MKNLISIIISQCKKINPLILCLVAVIGVVGSMIFITNSIDKQKPTLSTPINSFKSTEVQIQSEEKSNVDELVTENEESSSDSEPKVVETNNNSPEQGMVDQQLEKPQQSTVVESKEVLNLNSADLTHEEDNVQDEIYYENCSVVRDSGLAPLSKEDPGYSLELDRDGDGLACE
ncbi:MULTISPECIES: excalibur calcium-binding domain-containing protein [Paenibacillus]|uniref:excalibur calcium-binding domain-containing protein n=1 Tax=Paenibacillus TaxID=44249 RepID=UPI0013764722|nr:MULTISPECIES: excalibur calcium-binding domain-containing protein [Paenibacillus]CAJ1315293.1 Excalibur domain-containing protein [Paenibacillus nuruki]